MSRRSSELAQIAALVATYLCTRILIIASLRVGRISASATSDVSYYGYYLWELLEQGAPNVMVEYPVPAVWLMQVIYWLGGGWQTWTPYFVATMLLLDLGVAASLYRRGNAAGAWFWILFTGAQGPTLWYRFDLIPAALVAWACVLISRRPALSGALIGLGAAVKLWPALLIGPLLAPDPRRGKARSRLLGFLVVGLLLAAASLITSGWSRSASALTWQSDRGLQVESVPATALMLLRSITDREDWIVFFSEYNTNELSGPGVEAMLMLSTGLTVLAVIGTVVISARLIINLRDAPQQRVVEAMLLAVLTVVLAMVVANKTLSPQYVVWLGGPVGALLLLGPSDWLKRHARVLAASLVLIGALTFLVFPVLYAGILANPTGLAPNTSVLVWRNLALISLLAYSARLTWLASLRERPRALPHSG